MEFCLKKLFIFIIFLSILTLSAVNASDVNIDNVDLIDNSDTANLIDNSDYIPQETCKEDLTKENSVTDGENTFTEDDTPAANSETGLNEDNAAENKTKTAPKISIKTSKLKSRDTLIILLKNPDNTPLKNKKVSLLIDGRNMTLKTNKNGEAHAKLLLLPKKYKITIQFFGDDDSNAASKKFTLKVSKMSTKIKTYANYVVRKNKLYIYLIGSDWKGVSKRKVVLKFNKKTYTKTSNKNGRVGLKISLPIGKYSISAKFKGDKYFSKSSKKFKFYVARSSRFYIGNRKLLKNGYLRIYLKDSSKKAISNKEMTIRIGSKKFVKRTNSEGIIRLKVDLPVKNHTVVVKYGKYSVNKRLACINDTVKDPLKYNIPLVAGAPDLDYMPGSYVMGDGSATYTLKRSQYREVLQRDSYCLFLNNRLSRYVFFKTKSHPKLNHVIKREKWNVIEREINKKIVKKNKYGYWPGQITVSIKGKSYKYSEVRDVQNTGYTCGPASGSVCTQVLRNYICEKYLAKISKTDRKGTQPQKLAKALSRNNFTCTYFWGDSFKIGLNELKKGGCALVFHAQDHYVSILDISPNGKKVLVSNSYGSYDNIPTKWVSVSYMNKKFGHYDTSLVVRLNYTLSESKKNSINCFYNSMGTKWNRHGPNSQIGRV